MGIENPAEIDHLLRRGRVRRLAATVFEEAHVVLPAADGISPVTAGWVGTETGGVSDNGAGC
jgi:hypothetical protein